MPRDSRAAFLRALAEVKPGIARAFEEAVQDIRSSAQVRVLEDVIRRYNAGEVGIETAMQEVNVILQLGRQFWAPLDAAVTEAYIAGGAYQAGLVPKRGPGAPRAEFRFDGRSERAEDWLRRNAGRLITEIGEDARTAIRETITEGREENRSYRRVARDLIGTTQGNQRKGGLVGLHSRQAQAVRAARRELEAGDYSAYLSRSEETRDLRFDSTIDTAQREGKALTADQVDRIAGRYADGLLQYRARMIARTEGNAGMNGGRLEAVEQMIDRGLISERHVTKRWVATIGKYTREAHVALSGTEVGWREKFISPATGYLLNHPHDEGAPAEDVVNCRCVMLTRPDFIAAAREREGLPAEA